MVESLQEAEPLEWRVAQSDARRTVVWPATTPRWSRIEEEAKMESAFSRSKPTAIGSGLKARTGVKVHRATNEQCLFAAWDCAHRHTVD
jgi:hypothetical protein